ncbi:MAG: ABC transporter ATP-binding protein [Ignavibacteriae bacterium]|nr:ABC transporter ATP-binding protein [Ignavibacteriota bacterium]
MSVITINNLRKEYSSKSFSKNRIIALDNVSFEVGEGEIFGLLGPNGAGKTTLVKILLGITFPTSGSGRLFDKDLNDVYIKSRLGYLPENHSFPNYFTGEQVLNYFGRLSGVNPVDLKRKTDEYLNIVGMNEWRKIKIRKYSKGMMQRIGLAQAMISNPDLIFLDEPTDGVDPIGRKEIRDVLLSLKAQGKTIFLNSHLLSEIEMICDRVAILNKGILVKEGRVEDITSTDSYSFVTSELSDEVYNALLLNYKAVIQSKSNFLVSANNLDDVNIIIDFLRKNRILIQSVAKEKITLESKFINLIEHKL